MCGGSLLAQCTRNFIKGKNMQNIILKNLENLVNGVFHVDKLPEAIKCISVGSRAFVRAVRAFQEAYGLVVDGELGPITMAAIEADNEKAAKSKKKSKKAPKKESIELD